MAKIEGDPLVYGLRNDLPRPKTRDKKDQKGGVQFSELIDIEESDHSSQAPEVLLDALGANPHGLNKVIDQIHQKGEELARHPSPETIQAYKKLLKQFLQTFVEKGLKTEKQISGRSMLNQKSYQIIKVIDEKLEKLVLDILRSQVTQIQILAKVEEIQGLLVNVLS